MVAAVRVHKTGGPEVMQLEERYGLPEDQRAGL